MLADTDGIEAAAAAKKAGAGGMGGTIAGYPTCAQATVLRPRLQQPTAIYYLLSKLKQVRTTLLVTIAA